MQTPESAITLPPQNLAAGLRYIAFVELVQRIGQQWQDPGRARGIGGDLRVKRHALLICLEVEPRGRRRLANNFGQFSRVRRPQIESALASRQLGQQWQLSDAMPKIAA